MLKIHKETLIVASMCLSGLTFGVGNLDSFPHHVFLILFLGATKFKYVDYFILISVLMVILVTTIVDISSYDASLFQRQVMNYMAIIVGAGYLIAYKPDLYRVSKAILTVLVLNVIIGCLQFYSDLFTLFSNARIDESGQRGAIGLFPEPTSFGLFCVFTFLFGMLNIKFNTHGDLRNVLLKIIYVSLFAILFINQSSTAILLLAIFTGLSMFRSSTGIVVFFLVCLFTVFSFYYLSESRFGRILAILVENDIQYLLKVDGSINERLSSVVGPYYGIIENNLLPSSTFDYKLTYLSMREATNEFFWWGGGDKIMNYLGNIIYELSFLGLILIVRYILPSFKSNIDFTVMMGGILLLSNSVPLLHGYPLLLFANYANKIGKEVSV
jgi:hypothetical protein